MRPCNDVLLFSIHDGRKDWINIIKENQSLNENHRLFVCDLHFNPNAIVKGKKNTILKKGETPSIGYACILSLTHFVITHLIFSNN